MNPFGLALGLALRVLHAGVLRMGLTSSCRRVVLMSDGVVGLLSSLLALFRRPLSAKPGLSFQLRTLLLMAPGRPLAVLPLPVQWLLYLSLARLAHLPSLMLVEWYLPARLGSLVFALYSLRFAWECQFPRPVLQLTICAASAIFQVLLMVSSIRSLMPFALSGELLLPLTLVFQHLDGLGLGRWALPLSDQALMADFHLGPGLKFFGLDLR